MYQLFSTDAIQQKSCPFVDVLDAGDSVLLLIPSSPEAEEASAPSTETRLLTRKNWCAHYVFRCLSIIVPRRYNRMRPIDVDNRMNIRLFYREELVIETTLCRAYDWLHRLHLRHLIHRKHLVSSTMSSATPSTMSSTVSMVHHHLHSPPLSITCEKGRGIRASNHGRGNSLVICSVCLSLPFQHIYFPFTC